MKKNLLISFLVLFFALENTVVFAQNSLRNPQGRFGNTYKTEKYNPVFKTNLTQEQLKNLHAQLKRSDNKNIKETKIKTVQIQKDNKNEIIEQQKAFNAQKKQELAKQKAEQQIIQKAEFDKQKKFEEEQKALQKIAKQELAEQLAEEKAVIKAEQDKQKAVLQAEKEKQRKLAEEQKLIAKQKQEEENKKLAEEKAVIKAEQDKQKAILQAEKEKQRKLAKEQRQIENQEKAEEAKPIKIENSSEQLALAKEQAIKTKLIENPKPPKEEKNKKILFIKNIFKKPVEQDNAKQETTVAETKTEKQTEPVKTIKQDPSTKAIVKEITDEISNERPQMLEDLSLLWVSAVQKSDTVYFAIMKLSNPNGEDVNKKGVQKILQPILNAAPLVGQAFVNPALSAGSLIGSNVMGTMMNDSATKRLTKVNDADLVILARSIDELQETLLMNYLAYKNALKEYELTIKIADSRKQTYDKLNSENSPDVVLANTFYTEALDNQYKARQEFLMKRVVLEQMVGADAINEMEKKTIGLAK